MKLDLIIAVLVILAGLSTMMVHYKNQYEKEHSAFELFKSQTQAAGEKAKSDALAKELTWKQKLDEVEVQHAKTLATNHDRFVAALAKLYSRPVSTGSGDVSSTTSTIGVCNDATGNQRLFDNLSVYRKSVLGLFETCQSTTDTLTACQATLKALQ